MKEQKRSLNYIESIVEGFTIKTDHEVLKEIEPMSVLEEDFIQSLRGKPGFLQDLFHFYRIDKEGNVALYFVCRGQEDLDWLLEKLECSVAFKYYEIHFVVKMKEKSISFCFHLNEIESIYSIIRLVLQTKLFLYYLLESEGKLYYLGYSELELKNQYRDKIFNYINKQLKRINPKQK